MYDVVIRRCRALFSDEKGVTALEYGVLAVAILAVVIVFASGLATQFTDIGGKITAAIGKAAG